MVTHLLEPDAIRDEGIGDREHYVERLGNYIADRRITLEVCLTSNLQTNPQFRRIEEHTFSRLRAQRLSTTICTDNRLVSNTTVSDELLLACRHLGLDRHDLKSIIIYGFKRSFFPGSYLRKRQYVRQIIDYYDRIEAHLRRQLDHPADHVAAAGHDEADVVHHFQDFFRGADEVLRALLHGDAAQEEHDLLVLLDFGGLGVEAEPVDGVVDGHDRLGLPFQGDLGRTIAQMRNPGPVGRAPARFFP